MPHLKRAAVLLLIALALGLIPACSGSALPSRPGFTWSLLNQDNAPFGSAELRGKVALVTFVYTRCPTVCPALTGQMKQLQADWQREGIFGTRAALVSITVDPQRDTTEQLKSYATQAGVDFSGWTWVTGEPTQLENVWQQFGVVAYKDLATLQTDAATAEQSAHAGHSAAAKANAPAESYEVIHTAKTVLLDGKGNLRAEYRGSEIPIQQVAQDVRALLAESR